MKICAFQSQDLMHSQNDSSTIITDLTTSLPLISLSNLETTIKVSVLLGLI